MSITFATLRNKFVAIPEPEKKAFTVKDNQPWEDKDDAEEQSYEDIACIKDLFEKLMGLYKTPTGCELDSGPLCGQPVYIVECTGQCVAFNKLTKLWEEIDMGTSTLRPVGGQTGSKVFESEIQDFIQVQAANPVTTVQDALDLAVAAGLPDLVCKETGQVIPATIDDICGYKVNSLQCEMSYLADPADITTATTVGPADAYYVGGVSVLTAMDDYGVMEGTRPVAAGDDAVAVWCFQLRRELSKAEIAVLPVAP